MYGFLSPCVYTTTVQIQLPTFIENVKEKLAENLHELWAMGKIENGWIWGEVGLRHDSVT